MIFGRKKRRINRLMIVEDEPLIAFDNENFLRTVGYEIVATVNSASAAMSELEVAPAPDAIVLDYYLADGTTGVEIARAATARGIAVLLVTGVCPEDARPFAMGCLSKPYAQRDLAIALDAMEALLAGEAPRQIPAALELYTPVRGTASKSGAIDG